MIRKIDNKHNLFIREFIKNTASLISKVCLLALIILMHTPHAYATFPGANGKIAFTSNRDGNNEIYVMNNDGSNIIRLTNNSASDTRPVWSPDGTKIVFQSDRDGNIEIYYMNSDGSAQIRLTNNVATDNLPTWSHDGNRIGFVSNRDGNNEIYLMNADGSAQTNLTIAASDDSFPNWSPNGNKIAFRSSGIVTINTDGTGRTTIANTGIGGGTEPNWSPDGSRLVFWTNVGSTSNRQIYSVDSDGSNLVAITTTNPDNTSPAFSPDGTLIAFTSSRDSNSEIYVMNADGTNQINLTNNNASDLQPAFQPIHSNSQSISTTTVPAGCSANKPVGAPQLFQIDTTGVNAKLHFSPINGASNYFIAYGYAAGDERFGTEFSLGNTGTAINHTINALEPNTTYYFKVRSGNGCMPGDWSNILKATTLYHNNSLGTKVFTAWEQMRDVVEGWLR